MVVNGADNALDTIEKDVAQSNENIIEKSVDANGLWTECHRALVVDKYYAIGVPMAKFIEAKFVDDDIIKVLVPNKSDIILLSNRENLTAIEEKLASIAKKEYKVRFICNENVKNDDTIIKKLEDILGKDTLKIVK